MISIDMKRNIIFKVLFIIVVLVTGFISCNTNSNNKVGSDNNVRFELISYNKVHPLVDNLDNPSCNLDIEVQFPIESDKYDLSSLQNIFQNCLLGTDYSGLSFEDAVEKYSSNYVSNYYRDAEVYRTTKPTGESEGEFDDIYHKDGEHVDLPEIFYSYYESIINSVVYNKFGIISFQVIQGNNKGGVVSYENVRNYVLNLSTGEFLSEGDIFAAGYDTALRPIIQNCIMQQNDVKTIDDLENLGFFGVEEIIPNKNFMLTEAGIIYTFNKGEYSAYQLPALEILIPYSYVRSILRENSIANKLSQL